MHSNSLNIVNLGKAILLYTILDSGYPLISKNNVVIIGDVINVKQTISKTDFVRKKYLFVMHLCYIKDIF